MAVFSKNVVVRQPKTKISPENNLLFRAKAAHHFTAQFHRQQGYFDSFLLISLLTFNYPFAFYTIYFLTPVKAFYTSIPHKQDI